MENHLIYLQILQYCCSNLAVAREMGEAKAYRFIQRVSLLAKEYSDQHKHSD